MNARIRSALKRYHKNTIYIPSFVFANKPAVWGRAGGVHGHPGLRIFKPGIIEGGTPDPASIFLDSSILNFSN
jgi:hypothetical protein